MELATINNSVAKDAGELATVARDQQELQASIISAKKFPRDEEAVYQRSKGCFARKGMAEAAQYRFERAGKAVTGPSVDTARELARLWGNLRYGLRIIKMTDEWVHIRGYSLDLETNTYSEAEDEFKPLIQRKDKKTGSTYWTKPDERDLRELINRRGAICVRNVILQILPPDLTDLAVETAEAALRKTTKTEVADNRGQVIKSLTGAFAKFGVTPEALDEYVMERAGVLLQDALPEDIAELREVYKSIQDGVVRAEQVFGQESSTPGELGLKDKLTAAKPKQRG